MFNQFISKDEVMIIGDRKIFQNWYLPIKDVPLFKKGIEIGVNTESISGELVKNQIIFREGKDSIENSPIESIELTVKNVFFSKNDNFHIVGGQFQIGFNSNTSDATLEFVSTKSFIEYIIDFGITSYIEASMDEKNTDLPFKIDYKILGSLLRALCSVTFNEYKSFLTELMQKYFISNPDKFTFFGWIPVLKSIVPDVIFEKDELEFLIRDKRSDIRTLAALRYDLSPNQMSLLSRDPDSLVRRIIAGNNKLPLNIQVSLSKDDDWHVRAAIAKRENLSNEIMENLTRDPHKLVRLEVSRRDDLPDDLIKIFKNDPFPLIQMRFKRNRLTKILEEEKDPDNLKKFLNELGLF